MLDFIIEYDNGEIMLNQSLSKGSVIFIFLLIAAFYITFYVLRSIGVYKLAKGQNIAHAFMAFIPGVWMFTACKIIGKSRILGYSAEKIAVLFTVIFTAAAVLPLVYDFLTYFPYIAYYFEGGSVSLISRNGGLYIECGSDFINHFDTQAINVICKVLSVANYLLRLAEIFVTVTVYIALFRKFWPEHYILAAVMSFFGLFPIFVFAIRNRQAVDFNEYIKRRYYGSGYTPYGNRYYGNNGQGGNASERRTPYYGNTQNGENEPFDEFSNRPEEPFGEFSDKKSENGNYGGDNNSDSGKDDKSDDYFQ